MGKTKPKVLNKSSGNLKNSVLKDFEYLPPNYKSKIKNTPVKPGPVTFEQNTIILNNIKNQVINQYYTNIDLAVIQQNLYSANKILESFKEFDIVGIPPDDAICDIGIQIFQLILQELEKKAWTNFRMNPTAANFRYCEIEIFDLLTGFNIELSKKYPVNSGMKCIIKPPYKPGKYKVKQGDSLSKLAKRFYGAANLWDAIYYTNMNVLNLKHLLHNDLIFPGTILDIQQGPLFQ